MQVALRSSLCCSHFTNNGSSPVQFSEGQVEAIRKEISEKNDDQEGTSILHHILRSDLPESEKVTSRLSCEAFGLLGAGTITTSSTLTVASYFILEDAEIQKRLGKELKDVLGNYPESFPRWADLEKIPFLTGCIKEGLRSVLSIFAILCKYPN